jgi:flagellar basal-body rod protein FlgC
MRAAGTLLNVSANNTANVNTDGFKRSRALASEGPAGSVVVEISKSIEPGPLYDVSGLGLVEGSNVDLVDEIIGRISAKRMFEANLSVFRTADEMEEALLDIKA